MKLKSLFKTSVITATVGLLIAYHTAVFAEGTMEDDVTTDDWRTYVQMDLDNGYYESALERLGDIKGEQEAESADWHNYMGYTLRKQEEPDLAAAETHYKKALELKADHKGALEYYGELKLLQNDLASAKALMKTLLEACPESCEELEELETSILEYSK